MSNYPITERNKVRRVPRRASYDSSVVQSVLDAGFVCHVSFILDDQPFIIPTIYGREDETIYIHGAASSRMLARLQEEVPVCLAVTHVDGLVLARSAFHHSVNYRSAVVFGKARLVVEKDKLKALEVITNQAIKGRWAEVRSPNTKELKATSILAINIDQASAKIRDGGPVDDPEDHLLDIWAGHLPLQMTWQSPITDPQLRAGISLPQSVKNILS